MGKRIVIIGAGSTNFGLKIIGDFYKSQILKGSTIVLHDIRPEAVEKTRKIAENYKEKLQVDFQIEATTSREEALQGADFCLISIEVGNRFELWEQDWGVPVEYGFKQIYGENGGPGGLFHALRIIPVIIEICEDIEKICPNAVVFNYSNPMQRICHALTTKFPNLNIIGLCHEIHSMERQLPTLLDTNLDNIEFEAGGLNHFSILLDVKYKDTKKDGYPIIRDKFNSYYSNLINDHEGFESDPGAERGVFFELFKKYSYLPITTDSHVGEYMQWAFSVADHEGISDFYKKYKKKINKQNYKIATYQIIRDSIDQMIRDLIKNTKTNLKINKIKNYKDITKANLTMVDFSEKVKDSVDEIRFFLKTKMYNNNAVLKKNDNGKLIIKKLFNKIQKNPKKFISKDHLSKDKYRAISDFISGMTDRYAINLHKNFK